jgi:ComF family protein
MIDSLLSPIAPHLCCGCNRIGSLLCEDCKYNIVSEAFYGCILCGNKYNNSEICSNCTHITQRGWCVGQRAETLRKLIDDYKFENKKSTHRVLADLLDERVDQLPSSTIVVPVPTISRHIRQRGYDHAALLARSFARRRGLAYRPLVGRQTNTSQRDASRLQRKVQAQEAFIVRAQLSPNQPYLLIDDIVTTGATLTYAAKALRAAGARDIWFAALAHQPIDA